MCVTRHTRMQIGVAGLDGLCVAPVLSLKDNERQNRFCSSKNELC